jgi:hypothetical protein
MYESPIKVDFTEPLIEQLKNEADEYVVRACQRMIPTVNKEELIKALQYDRDQYLRGYTDGLAYKPPINTNADRIRAMSDEELADWLACGLMLEEVRSGMNNGAFETHADALLWWLKQEAKE